MSRNRVTVTNIIMEDESEKNLYELCEICHIEVEEIKSYIDYGMLEPKGKSEQEWKFPPRDIARLQRAKRLQQDLDINLPGVALAIELLEEIDHLREKLSRFE